MSDALALVKPPKPRRRRQSTEDALSEAILANLPASEALVPLVPEEKAKPAPESRAIGLTDEERRKPLDELIDTRFKDLLAMCTDTKQLTDALKAASSWEAVKRKTGTGDDDDMGSALQ